MIFKDYCKFCYIFLFVEFLRQKFYDFINFVKYYSFLHRHDEAFSTEPMKNTPKTPLTFGHVQVNS